MTRAQASTRVGLAGFVVLAFALAATLYSSLAGVHCPECDRTHLTVEQFQFWTSYFQAKDLTYGLSGLLLALAIPLSEPRWPFVAGVGFVALCFTFTPM